MTNKYQLLKIPAIWLVGQLFSLVRIILYQSQAADENHIGFPAFHCPLSLKQLGHGVVFGHFKVCR